MTSIESNLESLEHEIKWVAPDHRAAQLGLWLEQTCLPDPSYPDGIVNSIYYDTPDLHMLHEKIDSDYLKTKIRLRWYEDAGTGTPLGNGFAEAKFRIGSRRHKVRVETDAPAGWLARQALTSGDLIAQPRALQATGIRIPQPLLPLIVVRYRRRRFIEPFSGQRISLDTGIAPVDVNPWLAPPRGGRPLRTAVIEIKGLERELPSRLRLIRVLGCRPASFSKYHACCEAATSP